MDGHGLVIGAWSLVIHSTLEVRHSTFLIRGFGHDLQVRIFQAHTPAAEADDADSGSPQAIDQVIDLRLRGHARDDAKIGRRKWLPRGNWQRAERLTNQQL